VISGHELSFLIDGVDPKKSLVIDPIIRAWGTYYGYSHTMSTATDTAGNVFITGLVTGTGSPTVIATNGTYQSGYNGGGYDAFLAKFDKYGNRLWGTFYGGSNVEIGYGCAVDLSGNVYFGGYSGSSVAIATSGSHQPTLTGAFPNGFLAKFTASGTRIWATYYGGTLQTVVYGCATDLFGNVFITGITDCATSISTPGSHQSSFGGQSDAFLVKFNGAGVRQWGTYYGGAGNREYGASCATDPLGNVYFCGMATPNTPAGTPGAFQPNFIGGLDDALLVKFNPAGVRLWATFYGNILAEGGDAGYSCATDPDGNVFMCGVVTMNYTVVPAPPPGPATLVATPGSHQPLPGSLYSNAYLVKFDSTGIRQWGTYYGARAGAVGCSADSSGNIYLVGGTSDTISSSLYATPGCHQPSFGGGNSDSWMAKFDAAGVRQYGTYYGGTVEDLVYTCSVNRAGDFYMAGLSSSSNGTSIATPGSHQPAYLGTNANGNSFLVRFADCSPIITWPSQTNVSCAGGSNGSASLTAFAGGSPVTYSWLPNGGASGTLGGLGAGSYTAIAVSNCGVREGVIFTITAPPSINVLIASSNSLICAGEIAVLTANGSGGTGPINYSWSTGSGANTSTVSPLLTSQYSVTATDANGCTQTSAFTQSVNLCLSIDNNINENKTTVVYPNPVTSRLCVESPGPRSLMLSNAVGQTLISMQTDAGTTQLNMDQYPKGIYFIVLSGGDKKETVKVVKE